MGLLSWIVIGLIAGLLVRKFFPGRQGGSIPTLVLALVGALVGGYISSYFSWGTLATIEPRALLLALLGALVMLLVAKILRL
ncbi:GlsB/YeaQ/YmgE family stress response membrane protein [Erwiniaceae bacterium BAC15a-03b]|uniref:GlsB/YeaQ/YmgE family stress response membrane protein n=1 Tax=Winslowiella arboricola TaxID=2978220 RepID=A0A9J6PCR4_9GAMM|nr:GlsB/YeaQ/YmgE family stress response membrane protein [Winslowiella arboricola]MCU5771978.1 GlsB/YeaQ/YmgE family stress response membrane protein [Winslowiella arboricola]MCU5775977.1 GlsB/YeaQ/YmgE family stress response membrane protein [Winslowiella arboricola]